MTRNNGGWTEGWPQFNKEEDKKLSDAGVRNRHARFRVPSVDSEEGDDISIAPRPIAPRPTPPRPISPRPTPPRPISPRPTPPRSGNGILAKAQNPAQKPTQKHGRKVGFVNPSPVPKRDKLQDDSAKKFPRNAPQKQVKAAENESPREEVSEKVQELFKDIASLGIEISEDDLVKFREHFVGLSEESEEFNYKFSVAQDAVNSEKLAHRRLGNARRQYGEMARSYKNPGKIDVKEFDKNWQRDIKKPAAGDQGLRADTTDAKGRRIGYEPFAEVGGSAQEILERNKSRLNSGGIVDVAHRPAIDEAIKIGESEVRQANLKLRNFIDHGVATSQEDLDKLEYKKGKLEKTVDALRPPVNFLNKFTHRLGRGVTSKADYRKDSRFNKLLSIRNEALSRLIWQLSPNKNYNDILSRVMGMNIGDDLNDPTAYEQMRNLIVDEARKCEKISEDQIKNLQSQMDQIHEVIKSESERINNKEDDMWKLRVLHLFLVLSPFGSLVFMGEFFNWVGPLADIFGPMFDSSLNFGEKIASIGSNENIDIFGKMLNAFGIDLPGTTFEALGLDHAMEFIFEDIPIIDMFGNIYDAVIGFEILNDSLGVVGPGLVGSPLVPVGVAALYSLYRAKDEVDHYCDVKESMKKSEKAINRAVKDFDKSSEKELKEMFEKMAKKRYEITQRANLVANLLKFSQSLSDKELEDIFSGIKLRQDETFQDMFRGNPETALANMMDILSREENAAIKDKIMDKLLVAKMVKELDPAIDEDKFIKEVRRVFENTNEREKFIDAQKAKINLAFANDGAQNRGLMPKNAQNTNEAKKITERLKSLICEIDAKEFMRRYKIEKALPNSDLPNQDQKHKKPNQEAPSKSVEPRSAEPIGNQQAQQSNVDNSLIRMF